MIRKIVISLVVLALSVVDALAQKLSLSDAVRIGLENNYNLKIAAKNVDVAVSRNTWGQAGALPSISLGGRLAGEYEAVKSTSALSGQLSVDASWTLFGGFLIKSNKALLENNEEFVKGSEMLQIENSVHSIINSYYYVLMQQEMLKINQTMMKISEDRFAQEKIAMDIGTRGTYEYIQAQSAYLTDQSNYMQQQMKVRESIRSLNLLLSLDPSEQWILSDSVDIPVGSYDLESMRDKMLSDNKTLRNQYINIKAREIEIQQQTAAIYPTIGVNGSLGGGDPYLAGTNSAASTSFFRPSLGLTFSYNIFNGGKARRNIAIAKVSKEIESLTTDQMKLSLDKELFSQFDNYNVYKGIVDIDEEQLKVAEINLKMSEERYKNGTISSFNYRDVQLSYLRSATARIVSIYNLIVANSALLKLTGGIMQEVK